MKGKLIKTELGFQLFDENMKYITSYGTKGLSLKNCQAIERGYDLEELVDKWCRGNSKIEDNLIKKALLTASKLYLNFLVIRSLVKMI